MKKIIAFVLSLLMINLSLVSCFKRDREEPEEYSWGDDNITFSFPKTVNALIKSDTNEFDINDVTFDFYYGLYRLDDQTMEEAKKRYSYHDKRLQHSESCFAIYFSKTGMNIFEMGDDYRILDFENVDGQLYKFITCEEAFETDYGFLIAKEFFASSYKKLFGTFSEQKLFKDAVIIFQYFGIKNCLPELKIDERLQKHFAEFRFRQ